MFKNKRYATSVSEDFFFAEFAHDLAFEPHCWYYGFFWLGFYSFSFDAFSADPLRQQSSFDACGITAVGHCTVFLGPSAPNYVSTIHRCVFTAPE